MELFHNHSVAILVGWGPQREPPKLLEQEALCPDGTHLGRGTLNVLDDDFKSGWSQGGNQGGKQD